MLKDKLNMAFDYVPITYGEIKLGEHKELNIKKAKIAKLSNRNEKSLCETMMRLQNRETYFSEKLIYEDEVCKTITARGGELWISNTGTCLNSKEIINAQTFPQDYNFINPTQANIRYICGMFVPPIMIKRIVTRLIESGVFDYKIVR